mgnify:CR=1 FL=1
MKTIGFIGLGLIGGSIAKTIRKFHPDYHILAYAKHKETLAAALNCGAIDGVLEEKDDRYRSCDYIFLCAPVEYNIEYLKYLKDIIKDGCIITDAGSVKGPIHKAVEELGMENCFIGGHPMAGSERSGFEYSSDHLLENAYYILTPGGQVPLEKITEFSELIDSLGSIPMVLTCEEHDFITAGVSHLPHIIASSLVNFVKTHDTHDEMMKNLAAGGFKDITRIASSSPIMWQNICLKNKDNIVDILDKYIDSLEDFKEAIEREDDLDLYNRFESSRNYRNSMPSSSAGPIKKAFAVYCDIIDEAGGIAAIATILASNNISIKNIGIVHNREFEEGVLRIEFYDEDSSKRAVGLLQKFRYIVYER